MEIPDARRIALTKPGLIGTMADGLVAGRALHNFLRAQGATDEAIQVMFKQVASLARDIEVLGESKGLRARASDLGQPSPPESVVDLKFSVTRSFPDGCASLRLIDGGVTGHEGFYLRNDGSASPDVIRAAGHGDHGMSLCAGTEGRWDSLRVPLDQWAPVYEAAMRIAEWYGWPLQPASGVS
jgi:hypothetical protein